MARSPIVFRIIVSPLIEVALILLKRNRVINNETTIIAPDNAKDMNVTPAKINKRAMPVIPNKRMK
jgi:hypothetical protein